MRLLRALVRIFFTHFYTRLAWTYDAVAWLVSLGRWQDWVFSAAPAAELDPVLEVGFGPGHLLSALLDQGRAAFGAEASRQMTRIAARRLRRRQHPLHIVQAQAQALPFAAGAFGSVISTFPTEYVLAPTTPSEWWRVLQPGGRLAILPMAEIVGQRVLERLAAWLFRVTGQSGELPAQWERPFQQAGFRIERQELEVRNSRVIRIVGQR